MSENAVLDFRAIQSESLALSRVQFVASLGEPANAEAAFEHSFKTNPVVWGMAVRKLKGRRYRFRHPESNRRSQRAQSKAEGGYCCGVSGHPLRVLRGLLFKE